MVSPSITSITRAVSGGELQPIRGRINKQVMAKRQILLVILPHPLNPPLLQRRGGRFIKRGYRPS
jgi:hypothetical protein